MVKKGRKKKIAIGIIVIFFVGFLSLLFFNNNSGPNTLTISIDNPTIVMQEDNENALNFCTNEQDCFNYLHNQGMPEGFLELNGYQILCEDGNCYTKKI